MIDRTPARSTQIYVDGVGATTLWSSGTHSYDGAGSMTAWNGNAYSYDPFAMAWQVTASGNAYVHLYTADEERIWTFQSGQPSRWTVRGLDGKVMREFGHSVCDRPDGCLRAHQLDAGSLNSSFTTWRR